MINKKQKCFKFIILLSSIVLVLAGGAYIWQSCKSDQTDLKRINFIAAIANSGYWGRAADGAIQAGKNRNMDVKCLGQTNLDSQELLDNLEISVNSCVDGIITYGLNQSDEFLQLLKEANKKQIPVVIIDSDVETEDKLCYIGIDDYGSGWDAGEEMVRECGEEAQILMVVSDKSVMNQIERLNGFKDAIQQYPMMEIADIIECGSSTLMAQRMISKKLEECPDINAIFCAEGVGAGACCMVMKKQEKIFDETIHIIGYDYNYVTQKALKNGYLSACIQQDSRQMGEMALEVLDRYMKDGILPDKTIYTDALMVKKDNIEESRKIDSGQTKIEWNYY